MALPESARAVIVGGGVAGAGGPPPRSARDGADRRDRPGAAVGDRGLDLARPRARLPAQCLADHDPARAVDGADAVLARDAFHPVGASRWRQPERWAELDRRWGGRARTARTRRCSIPRRPSDAAASPHHDHRCAPHAQRRHRQGRARGRGGAATTPCRRRRMHEGPPGSSAGGGPREHRQLGRSERSTCHRRGIWGPGSPLAGANVPLVPVEHQFVLTAPLPELAGETPRSCTRSCATRTTRCTSARYGDAYGSATTATSRAWPSPSARRSRVHARRLRRRARRGGADAAGVRARGRPRVQRTMSFTPDGFPLLGERRDGPRPGLRAGDLGHPSGGWAGAGRAHDPRRRAARPARVRPPALDAHGTSRAYMRAARGAGTARSTTSSTRASRRAGARPAHARPSTTARRRSGAEFFESAGWERPQWYEANPRRSTGDDGPRRTPSGRRATGRRSAQAEHLACRERVASST